MTEREALNDRERLGMTEREARNDNEDGPKG
jgi:hypothetical protein